MNIQMVTHYLKVSVDGIKCLGVFRQLRTDVFGPNEDALKMRPCELYLKPDGNDRVGCGQLLLPVGHLLQKVANKLRRHHVLQLDLGCRIGGSALGTPQYRTLSYFVMIIMSPVMT